MSMNLRVFSLWSEGPPELRGTRVPKLLHPQPKGGTLFLSLNPAFRAPLPAWIANELYGPGQNFTAETFLWDQFGDYADWKAAAHARLHQLARTKYRWFSRLNILSQRLGQEDYALVDLFLRLEAQARNLPVEFHHPDNHAFANGNGNFIQNQLDIAFDQIVAAKPVAIVGVYVGASNIFLRYFRSRFGGLNVDEFQPINQNFPQVRITTLPAQYGWLDHPVPFFCCRNLPSIRGMSDRVFASASELIVQRIAQG